MDILKRDIINNDRGSAIIIAILMSLALTTTVFIAMENSTTSSRMMRSHRDYRDRLYRAETGITIAQENHLTTWLNSTSNLFNFTNYNDQVGADVSILDENGANLVVASYVIARIESAPPANTTSASLAYMLNHQAPPPIGDGTSPKSFEIRRYGIQSTVAPENTITVESGLSKYFNK